ncbi:MAG: 2OG-Fe(II) oxygenase [Sphingobium sp.]
MFGPGDPVPSLYARGATNPRYALDSVAGRYVAITFIASTRVPGIDAFLKQLYASRAPFDDVFASAFIVSSDPEDETERRLGERYPGIRVFWDHDRTLAEAFGCSAKGGDRLSLTTWILDPALRVIAVLPVKDPLTHHATVCAFLSRLPKPAEDTDSAAPVLQVPNLIEPELCREYIAYCEASGPQDSGYMKTDPATGNTIMVVDHSHKRRNDCLIEDGRLRDALQARIIRRLVPQIQRAFQFKVTRMERYLIARYDAESGGYFRPHKDNTTLGTAHRRFAVSINLNAGEYDGGDLRFPEFGMRTYRPATGGAVVFSCSLLHEATPVTRGSRYCILPFLYDEAAAAVRLENAQFLADDELRKNVVASVTATPKTMSARKKIPARRR